MATFEHGFGNRALGYPYINLDHVAELRPRDGFGFDCLDIKGNRIGSVASVPESRAVVPNIHVDLRLVALFDPDYVQRYPIIAWRIDGFSAIPITYEDLDDQLTCIEWTEGGKTSYVFPEDCICDTWESALERLKESLASRNETRARMKGKPHGNSDRLSNEQATPSATGNQ